MFLNGQPSYVINQWVSHMIRNGVGQSLLQERLRAVLHLCDFCFWRYGDEELSPASKRTLVTDFLEAKQRGTGNGTPDENSWLGWKPANRNNLKRYLAGINTFDEWQATYHLARRLNPFDTVVLDAVQSHAAFRSREKWDLLLHLFPSRSLTQRRHSHQLPAVHKRHTGKRQSTHKVFPLEAFVDLVEQCSNPRDKMLYLQLFGLGMRGSEVLHLYLEDVFGVSKQGEARVRLDDPETGEWRWFDSTGKSRRGSRSTYLQSEWANEEFRDEIPQLHRLRPRTLYGSRGGMHSGFKGMSFHFDESASPELFGHEALWIDPRLGVYYLTCLKMYLAENFHGKPPRWPFHPWLYIQLDRKSHGMPMTIPALRKMWMRDLSRLKLGHLGLGLHSLRHLAGYYCASVLHHPLPTTQALLRHASQLSTETYYHLSPEVVREQLRHAVGTAFMSPSAHARADRPRPVLDLPKHWAPRYRFIEE
ncbi:hypothetical protein ACFFYR_33150 [Paraburkholderia dipogonis]|uniref:hypothetical protein n=1 Tax=Paraburkholderia dipogonis TaxID=1211383 RepID=UPI0035EB2189